MTSPLSDARRDAFCHVTSRLRCMGTCWSLVWLTPSRPASPSASAPTMAGSSVPVKWLAVPEPTVFRLAFTGLPFALGDDVLVSVSCPFLPGRTGNKGLWPSDAYGVFFGTKPIRLPQLPRGLTRFRLVVLAAMVRTHSYGECSRGIPGDGRRWFAQAWRHPRL